MLKAWEKEIRADQDKITRHACAEATMKVCGKSYLANDVHAACMNVKAV